MALSEYEQQQLAEMERRLYASEADSVQTTPTSTGMPTYRAIVIGALAIIVGIALLVAGAASGQIWLGLLGFVAMLGGVLFIVDPRNRVKINDKSPQARTKRTSLAERAERRWDERMEGER